MTLRIKLVSLLAAAILVSTTLFLWLAWERVGKEMVAVRERDMLAAVAQDEERLEEDVAAYLADRARSVMERRTRMRLAAVHLLGRLREGNPRPGETDASALSRILRGDGTLLAGFFRSGSDGETAAGPLRAAVARTSDFAPGAPGPLGLSGDLVGFKQLPLRDIAATLPPEGTFTVVRCPARKDGAFPGGASLLVHLVPVPSAAAARRTDTARAEGGEGEILVLAVSLDDLEARSLSFKRHLLRETHERYLNTLDPETTALILDEDLTVLASTSNEPPLLPPSLEATMRDRKTGNFAGLVVPGPEGEVLCAFRHMDTLGWIVVFQRPLASITSQVDTVFMSFGLLAVLLALAFLVPCLVVLTHTLRPLARLTGKTRALAHADLGSPEEVRELARIADSGPDLARHDELGTLSRAYAAMGRALADNITRLVEETETNARVAGELRTARRIQMGMLPRKADVDRLLGINGACFMRPAREVGGDMYDVFELADGRLVLAVGDVAGKGVSAALFMSMTTTLLRCLAENDGDPARTLTRANALLEANNPENMFVTLFLAVLDPATGRMDYANAGHTAPVLMARDGTVRRLDRPSGPVLAAMPDMTYRLQTTTLADGELLVLLTDGVTESRNPDGAFFGCDGLVRALEKALEPGPRPCADILSDIVADVDAFAGTAPQADDITLLLLRHATPANPSDAALSATGTRRDS